MTAAELTQETVDLSTSGKPKRVADTAAQAEKSGNLLSLALSEFIAATHKPGGGTAADPAWLKLLTAILDESETSPLTAGQFCLNALRSISPNNENFSVLQNLFYQNVNALTLQGRNAEALDLLEHAALMNGRETTYKKFAAEPPAASMEARPLLNNTQNMLQTADPDTRMKVMNLIQQNLPLAKAVLSLSATPQTDSLEKQSGAASSEKNAHLASHAGSSTENDLDTQDSLISFFMKQSLQPLKSKEWLILDSDPEVRRLVDDFIANPDPQKLDALVDGAVRALEQTETQYMPEKKSRGTKEKPAEQNEENRPSLLTSPPEAQPDNYEQSTWWSLIDYLHVYAATNLPDASRRTASLTLNDSIAQPYANLIWDRTVHYLTKLSDQTAADAYNNIRAANEIIINLWSSMNENDPRREALRVLAGHNGTELPETGSKKDQMIISAALPIYTPR